MRTVRCVLLAGLVFAAPAAAQDTISLYGDTGSGLSRGIRVTPGVPFDLVVQTVTTNDSAASEFVLEDDVKVLFPSVFRLSINKVNDPTLALGDNSLGEYLLAYAVCIAPGTLEVVRINYGDFGGEITNNVVIHLRGFEPGDTRPSSFDGSTGYVDCSNAKHPLSRLPWPADYPYDPVDWGAPTSDSAVVLNPPVPTAKASLSTVKTRY